MKNRSRTDKFDSILGSATGERAILPIRLMHTVFLSFDQSKEYFKILLKHGYYYRRKILKYIEQQRKD